MPSEARPAHELKATLFRVLGHPVRVRILELLTEGERSVGTLQAALGSDSGGTSQHLSALKRVGPRRVEAGRYDGLLSGRRRARLRVACCGAGSCRASTRRSAGASARAGPSVSVALLLAGLALLAVGGLLALVTRSAVPGVAVQALGAVAVGVAGLWELASRSAAGSGFTNGFGLSFGVDGLSGLFLGTLGLVAAPALLYSAGLPRPDEARTGDGAADQCVRARACRSCVRA